MVLRNVSFDGRIVGFCLLAKDHGNERAIHFCETFYEKSEKKEAFIFFKNNKLSFRHPDFSYQELLQFPVGDEEASAFSWLTKANLIYRRLNNGRHGFLLVAENYVDLLEIDKIVS